MQERKRERMRERERERERESPRETGTETETAIETETETETERPFMMKLRARDVCVIAFSFALLLSSLELSDTIVYALDDISHFVLKSLSKIVFWTLFAKMIHKIVRQLLWG